MILLPLINILSVDLSYRNTGIALIRNENGSPTLIHAYNHENPPMEYGFEGLMRMSHLVYSTIDEIRLKAEWFKADVVLVEMPCFSQNAKSAIAIGLLWGCIADLDYILVEPSFLKIWSGSKRGDEKKKVKEKVMERTCLDKKQLANDNITDAIGIGLAFCDLININ